MAKRLLILILPAFLLFTLICQAQFDTAFAKAGIHRCADSLIYGFKTRNWNLFTRYTNPALIGTLGGKDEFIRYISQTFTKVPDTAWKLYKQGKILQVIKTTNELQSLIELNSIIEWQGYRITNTAYMLGQSWDGGMFWTFFDTQSDLSAARNIKPDISKAIIIPPKKEKIEPMPVPSGTKRKQPPPPAKPTTGSKRKNR
jgi:hypothetical protein